MLAIIYAGILLAIVLGFSLLAYIAQSPLWRLKGTAQADANLPSAPLINPKYLGTDDVYQSIAEARPPSSTGARLGWSLLIGLAWSAGFMLVSNYLSERYRFDPLGFADPGRSIREGFLISTGSLCGVAMLVNLTLWAMKRRLRTLE
jgi:hypothetical protein